MVLYEAGHLKPEQHGKAVGCFTSVHCLVPSGEDTTLLGSVWG